MAAVPAKIRPTMFVVTHIRQALQHAVASGAFSDAWLKIGSARTFARASIFRV